MGTSSDLEVGDVVECTLENMPHNQYSEHLLTPGRKYIISKIFKEGGAIQRVFVIHDEGKMGSFWAGRFKKVK